MTNKLEAFRLEEYLATREFYSKYMFCASDLESRTIKEVLDLLPAQERDDFFNLSLAYTLPEGNLELRQEISSIYTKLSADNVLCFAGAEEAIYSAATVFLGQNDHAITVTPCYQSLASVAKGICEVSTVSLELIDGQWDLDIQKLIGEIRPNTKVIFINFPHNPTGYIPTKQAFQSIMDAAKENGIIVFSDEVYRGIELDPKDKLPSASEIYSNAISLGVMSKSFGCAGLRIGWVSSQNPDLLEKLGKFKHYLSICNSAPSEWLATKILKNRNRIIVENTQLVKENYELVKKYFTEHNKLFQWAEPKGGCTAYPKYLGKDNILDVADKLIKDKGVVILPSWVYEQDNQHFRISFGRKNCQESLKHFSDFFSEKS